MINKEIIVDLINQGFSQRKIADELNVSHSTIRFYLEKYQLETSRILKERKDCLNCGKKCNRSATIYCSNKCQKIYESHQIVTNWLNGIITGLNINDQVIAPIRNYLIEQADFKCQECNWGKINTYTGKPTLEIHHVDGNSENNHINNLKVLCPNCHSLTANYKGRNRGKGRHDRMERYKAGKSY